MEKKVEGPICICPKCPSFAQCGAKAFCFTGKSKCIAKEQGCLCPACPVQEKNGFSGVYYCIRGAAKPAFVK
ncbi:MAG: DUF2769 domain-containing protein [Candidatus Micrarchaeia archaeon]|jgi:hypothetical protein